MNRITIGNIPVDVLTMKQTIDLVDNAIRDKRSIHHVVINAVKVVNARKDRKLKESIINCDIINADGQGIIWASRILNKPLPERVAGIDLMENLVAVAGKKKYRIFFLGAKEDILLKVVKIYSDKYGKDIIAGYSNGYFNATEEEKVALKIAQSKADILFVAMSSPKKEIFLNTYKHLIQAPFIMGVGGSFDVIAGIVKRAPKWMQKNGLEWLYRTLQEPRRMWKRYLFGNSSFIYLVIKEKLGFLKKDNGSF
ncbi:glycosyltransferase [Hanamia caeni]|jgi:N-acetylglucosaminyldiphosphoundecaprenol N-acetyl-beta-D-mannosaminyltransferase|uniref:Glycosyltransferase n=1 Tax=Hanamia caeni TaxID=2294116 RepID=A0A3M9NI47_9BACT|nr:WecB/TagA/CpsF family glycosyltransferase [Hanamia caeni]RNI37489.1 glycosyltransferase [Hanamia caeni]